MNAAIEQKNERIRAINKLIVENQTSIDSDSLVLKLYDAIDAALADGGRTLMSDDKVTLAPPYDWKKTLAAGLRRGGMALLGMVGAGLLMLGQDPNALKGVLENAKVSAALIPLITAGIAAWANWQKNRDKG